MLLWHREWAHTRLFFGGVKYLVRRIVLNPDNLCRMGFLDNYATFIGDVRTRDDIFCKCRDVLGNGLDGSAQYTYLYGPFTFYFRLSGTGDYEGGVDSVVDFE